MNFQVIKRDGLVFIERAADEAFRKALLAGVPSVLRGKMKEALSDIPHKGSRAHSVRYFGGPENIAMIQKQIAPLLIELNEVLTNAFNLPGLFDWLLASGYGNTYRMIKVFKEWSEMTK